MPALTCQLTYRDACGAAGRWIRLSVASVAHPPPGDTAARKGAYAADGARLRRSCNERYRERLPWRMHGRYDHGRTGPMSYVRRFDHVGVTVADLDVVTAFFVADRKSTRLNSSH